jgi:mannose-1-phosphate guanylyltransferase
VKGLVLAAGRSTRIEAVSRGVPKPLLEVGGRSLLEWNLRWLVEAGVEPIWVNLHYRGEDVRAAVESMALPAGADMRFSVEDPILGTAGAWRKLVAEWDDTSLVAYGDNLTRFDIGEFVSAHRRGAALATVALFDPSRHANTGIAGSRVLVSADGRVEGFEEVRGGLAGGSLVSTGAVLLEPVVAERIPSAFADFGADVYPGLVREGELGAHVIETGGFCLGLDTPSHFEAGQRLVAEGLVTAAVSGSTTREQA